MKKLALLKCLAVICFQVLAAEWNDTEQYDHPNAFLFNETRKFKIPEGRNRIRILLVGGGGIGCKGIKHGRGGAGQVEVVIIDKINFMNRNKTFEVKVGKGGKVPTSYGQEIDNTIKDSSFYGYKAEGGKDCKTSQGFPLNTRSLEHFKFSRITRARSVKDVNISPCRGITSPILKSGEGGILINGKGPSAMPGKNNLSSYGGIGYGAGGGSGGHHTLPTDICSEIDGGDGAPGIVYIEVVPEVCSRPVSVVYAIEYSTNNSFTSQKKSISELTKLIRSFNKVGVLTFKDKVFKKIGIGEYQNKTMLLSAINDLQNDDSTENVDYSKVYSKALSIFQKDISSKHPDQAISYPKTLVMFTHKWDTNNSDNVSRLKKELKAIGVKIVVVGLDEHISKDKILEILNEDDHVYIVKGDDYNQGLPIKEPYILDTICRGSSPSPKKALTTKQPTFTSFQKYTAKELQKKYIYLLNYDMENVNINNTTEIQHVMTIADELIQNSHKIPNASKIAPGLKVIKFMEDFGLKMASTMAPLAVEENSPRHFKTNNLGLTLVTANLSSQKNIDLPDSFGDSHVILPKEAFTNTERGSVVLLTSNPVALMKEENNSDIITRIMTININPKSPDVFAKPVELVFDTDKIVLNAERVSCEFWDIKERHDLPHGSWSTEGCKLASNNETTVNCHCNHLTSFAVLTRIHAETKAHKQHEKYLSIITYVGCSISMLGCLLTIIVHAFLPSLRTERAFIHVNLVTAIFLGQGFFLAAALVEGPKAMCFFTAAALYFFYLSVFTWMLVEGLHIYCLVIRVFHSGHERKKLYLAIGWLLPFIITAICVCAFRGEFVSTKLCWLSVESGAIWSFVGPAIVIIAVNLVILILVLRVTAGVIVKDEIQNSSNRSLVRACITLLPILGLTWMFGILAFHNKTIVFEYLFCIFNSLQGLFIFLFYCVGSSEVRRECRRKLHNYETKRSLKSSQNTSGYNRSAKQTNSSKLSRNSEFNGKDKDTLYDNTLL